MQACVSLVTRAFLLACCMYSTSAGLVAAESTLEPYPPLGLAWKMSLPQIRKLAPLDRNADGSLQHSHLVHANSQTELVARWQDKIVTFLFASDFGLYAVGIETIPWTVQHTMKETDIEIRDMKFSAPVRLAIAEKYGTPDAVGALWSAEELTPLVENRINTRAYSKASLIDWDYGLSWLIWQGNTTRLSLGDQSVWYASQDGLAHRTRVERATEREPLDQQAKAAKKDAEREQRLQRTRRRVTSQAKSLAPLF